MIGTEQPIFLIENRLSDENGKPFCYKVPGYVHMYFPYSQTLHCIILVQSLVTSIDHTNTHQRERWQSRDIDDSTSLYLWRRYRMGEVPRPEISIFVNPLLHEPATAGVDTFCSDFDIYHQYLSILG